MLLLKVEVEVDICQVYNYRIYCFPVYVLHILVDITILAI